MYTRLKGAPNGLGERGSRWAGFLRDERGSTLRFAVAVVSAALLVTLAMTLVAEDLYRAYLIVFGP